MEGMRPPAQGVLRCKTRVSSAHPCKEGWHGTTAECERKVARLHGRVREVLESKKVSFENLMSVCK